MKSPRELYVNLSGEDTRFIEYFAYQELKDMCAVLAEALEYYADENTMASLTGLPYGRRARAALIKYKAKIGAE
jgi:hypothetical protein